MTAAVSLFADPTVGTVSMVQGDNREVSITYTLSEAPAVVTLDIETNVTGDVWASIGGENIQHVTGDVNRKVSGKETYTITWCPDFSWQGNLANARAVVTAWPLDNTPDYMVVDLLAEAGDNVRYFTSTNFLPGGLLADRKYRTTSIVMRKILAKGVRWYMGSVDDDTGRTAAQEYRHEVTLTNNYYMGVFEVTQAQWALVQVDKGNATPSAFALASYRAMRPVERVCYNEIRMADNDKAVHEDARDWPEAPYGESFLGRLRTRTAIDFDLPSDAEWEYACRAEHGDKEWNNGAVYTDEASQKATVPGRYGTKQPDGTSFPSTYKTTNASQFSSVTADYGTAICGSYAPSDWGLYDMHGNVGEWCLDWFQENLTGTDGSVVASGTQRVRRSGLGNDAVKHLRSAARTKNMPDFQHQFIGFRLACRAGLK